jgi:hypothetical protein
MWYVGRFHAAPLGLKPVPFERGYYKHVAPTELTNAPQRPEAGTREGLNLAGRTRPSVVLILEETDKPRRQKESSAPPRQRCTGFGPRWCRWVAETGSRPDLHRRYYRLRREVRHRSPSTHALVSREVNLRTRAPTAKAARADQPKPMNAHAG